MSRSGWSSMKAQTFFRNGAAFSPPRTKASEWNKQFPSPGCRTTFALATWMGRSVSGVALARFCTLPIMISAQRALSKNATAASPSAPPKASAPWRPLMSSTASAAECAGCEGLQSSGKPKPYLQTKQAKATPAVGDPARQWRKQPSPARRASATASTVLCGGGSEPPSALSAWTSFVRPSARSAGDSRSAGERQAAKSAAGGA
mmetsp:Transcript_34230/g.106277  ORF Transcript_34230/g.106277 Transcript_34230/m.106277 type:complete len:204 (+) Transcript_34230:340-951(+)